MSSDCRDKVACCVTDGSGARDVGGGSEEASEHSSRACVGLAASSARRYAMTGASDSKRRSEPNKNDLKKLMLHFDFIFWFFMNINMNINMTETGLTVKLKLKLTQTEV